ncbi:CsgE family curli-type amyloid fiber assembly protein [Tenacibaculum aiptasiae]|uniref:CsgE family curli-type amyloid fiber assembly protein n=1 Tax=Tenacibaculum aiptasiae TaxID=426481 RepID=UPI00232B021A|nr:CsgE family curli-type amyloid fiber assembly protein [Tenacibaculum aiptasiae]
MNIRLKKNTAFWVLVVFFVPFVCGQEFDTYRVKGSVNLTRTDDFLTLRAQVLNLEPYFIDELNYNFVALKKGVAGNYSKNSQSNDFSLRPKEEKQLSIIKINVKKNEELKVYLFIKHKNKLIHRDTLFLIPKKKAQKINEEQFLIRGIVIDEAITRIGKDYHDFFYKEYLVTGKNYPFIVKIVEKPALGRSSMISVEVEGKKIHEFFARPQEDYLKSNVVRAMRNLRVFNQKYRSTFSRKI